MPQFVSTRYIKVDGGDVSSEFLYLAYYLKSRVLHTQLLKNVLKKWSFFLKFLLLLLLV